MVYKCDECGTTIEPCECLKIQRKVRKAFRSRLVPISNLLNKWLCENRHRDLENATIEVMDAFLWVLDSYLDKESNDAT